MKISLVTPAGKQSRAGNRTTAVRWARILQDLGHRVNISEESDGDGADMMIAVHAWRSAGSIRTFSTRHPDKPLIVLLAGTDIYSFQRSHPEDTLNSMAGQRGSSVFTTWSTGPYRKNSAKNCGLFISLRPH